MFRDTSEELARLEAELLAQEPPEEQEEEDELEEDSDPWLYEDTKPAEGPVVFQNYSNGYGKNLRNYASGYRAYNTDHADEDLDRYSEQVRQPKKSGCVTGLITVLVTVALLSAAILLCYAWERGLL